MNWNLNLNVYQTIVIVFILTLIIFTLIKRRREQPDVIKINKLIRQTARWATAADQDINPYIANLHATYALGYLMSVREIYDDATINRLSNVDIRRLETEITNIMDNAIRKLSSVCPQGQPKNEYLAYLSKQGY